MATCPSVCVCRSVGPLEMLDYFAWTKEGFPCFPFGMWCKCTLLHSFHVPLGSLSVKICTLNAAGLDSRNSIVHRYPRGSISSRLHSRVAKLCFLLGTVFLYGVWLASSLAIFITKSSDGSSSIHLLWDSDLRTNNQNEVNNVGEDVGSVVLIVPITLLEKNHNHGLKIIFQIAL